MTSLIYKSGIGKERFEGRTMMEQRTFVEHCGIFVATLGPTSLLEKLEIDVTEHGPSSDHAWKADEPPGFL